MTKLEERIIELTRRGIKITDLSARLVIENPALSRLDVHMAVRSLINEHKLAEIRYQHYIPHNINNSFLLPNRTKIEIRK